jgi:hypothetical protein
MLSYKDSDTLPTGQLNCFQHPIKTRISKVLRSRFDKSLDVVFKLESSFNLAPFRYFFVSEWG